MERFLISVSIVILALCSVSFRWPINNPVLTSTYGESRGDHFHDGMDFVSSDSKVFPVKDGKLLYAWNRSLFPLENYWGGGNYKIIKHDEDIVSVYMHLQNGEKLEQEYTENDAIGHAGNTGRSYGNHIHFTILNQRIKESINPSSVMPPYIDEKKPDIKYFYIRIDDRYVRINENSDIRLTRHYPMLVEISDSSSGRERLGIFQMKVNFNGKDVLDVKYDKIELSGEKYTVSGRIFDDIYDPAGYYKIPEIKYREGLNKFIITVSDYSGNVSEKKFDINVNLDMN
jgi:hypothetical protein